MITAMAQMPAFVPGDDGRKRVWLAARQESDVVPWRYRPTPPIRPGRGSATGSGTPRPGARCHTSAGGWSSHTTSANSWNRGNACSGSTSPGTGSDTHARGWSTNSASGWSGRGTPYGRRGKTRARGACSQARANTNP